MDPPQDKAPSLKDLNTENITENTILINSLCEDLRMRYVMERLVSHLHDFARETRLSTREWMAGIEFLTAVGQICTDVRQVGYQVRPGKPGRANIKPAGIHSTL